MALEAYRKRHEKKPPQVMVVYRDGVSEGEFSQVEEEEIKQVQGTSVCHVFATNTDLPQR